MARVVKKTISLSEELAQTVEEIAREEGKSFSGVVQEAIRLLKRQRLSRELKSMQDYWSRKAREKGILTEEDLMRYLEE